MKKKKLSLSTIFSARWTPLRKIGRKIKGQLPDANFITYHYLYFIASTLIAALILWGSSHISGELRFIDAYFLSVSAMTESGLNTVNLSDLNTFQQVVLFIQMIIGSAIFVSAFVVHVRRRAFLQRFRVIEEERLGSLSEEVPETLRAADSINSAAQSNQVPLDDAPASQDLAIESPARGAEAPNAMPMEDCTTQHSDQSPGAKTHCKNSSCAVEDDAMTLGPSRPFDHSSRSHNQDHIKFRDDTRFSSQSPGPRRRVLSFSGVGARDSSVTDIRLTLHSSRPLPSPIRSDEKRDPSMTPTVSRNSNFHHMTDTERLSLGGKEYKAVSLLAWIVPLYFVIWQLLTTISLGAYISNYYSSTTRQNGLNPWWVGAFNAVSAFNNSGMMLLDANMTAFNKAIYLLFTMALLILAGNTCFPVFLRFIIWTFYRLLPTSEKWKDSRDTLKFLLDHPRRCYTNLFPAQHTWWLLLSVITLNGIDCAMFAVLNIGNEAITRMTPSIEFVNGLFQAIAVRNGGFYVVPMSSVRVSLQVLYVIMMYISAYPVAITIRNSNVYEERSLGIYSDDPGYDALEKGVSSATSWAKKRFGLNGNKSYFVQQQLRAQLAHDLWWLVLAVFLIMIIEGSQFAERPAVFSVWNVIFEVVSGYGTVGISVGLPDEQYSFSGGWHSLSKLILCAVMLRGRHRGLPVAIDKAVLLPSDTLNDLEEEDAHIRSDRCSLHETGGACS